MKAEKEKKKREFSKTLLIQESVLIWIMTLSFIVLAYICIKDQQFGDLPWLTAMAGFPWTAYGVSQMFYYKKALAENTKDGIKYETVLEELRKKENEGINNIFVDDTLPPYDSSNQSGL